MNERGATEKEKSLFKKFCGNTSQLDILDDINYTTIECKFSYIKMIFLFFSNGVCFPKATRENRSSFK
jgi:hypothetical protein